MPRIASKIVATLIGEKLGSEFAFLKMQANLCLCPFIEHIFLRMSSTCVMCTVNILTMVVRVNVYCNL